MAKAPKKKKTKPAPTPPMITVLVNQLTDAEMDEMSEQFLNHQGPYLTIGEILAMHQAKQNPESPESQPTNEG